ncbi:MAG: Asp23/Gls24 family envelope stress response protein [Oscillospiraceae bacterium]|nr:Asp23/Gls24 family envelope stress response protein [Oscillospiraceae bacterium]
MAENKEYISQNHEGGSVHISEEVVASVAAIAAMEVDGVCGLSAKIGADIAEMLGKKNLGKGVRLTVGEANDVTVDCYIVVELGGNVMAIAKNVQDAVASALSSITGLTVAAVNVTVAGIALPKDGKK